MGDVTFWWEERDINIAWGACSVSSFIYFCIIKQNIKA